MVISVRKESKKPSKKDEDALEKCDTCDRMTGKGQTKKVVFEQIQGGDGDGRHRTCKSLLEEHKNIYVKVISKDLIQECAFVPGRNYRRSGVAGQNGQGKRIREEVTKNNVRPGHVAFWK